MTGVMPASRYLHTSRTARENSNNGKELKETVGFALHGSSGLLILYRCPRTAVDTA